MIKSKILAAILASLLLLSSCGLSPNVCENGVRRHFEGKSIWVKSISPFSYLILTKDSVVLFIKARDFSYPYFSNVDTLFSVKH